MDQCTPLSLPFIDNQIDFSFRTECPLCTRSNNIDIYDITITEQSDGLQTPPPSAIFVAPDPDPLIVPMVDGYPFSTA